MFTGKMLRAMVAIAVVFVSCASLGAQLNSKTQLLDTNTAYSQLDSLNAMLTTNASNLVSLKIGAAKLEVLRESAKSCVEKSESQLKAITELLTSIQTLREKSTLIKSGEYKYLQNKKEVYSKQVADCRLLIFRTQETVANYKDVIQKLSTHTLLKRSTSLWNIHKIGLTELLKTIDTNKLIGQSGITQLSLSLWISLLGLLIVFVGMAVVIRRKCKKCLKAASERQPFILALIATIKAYIIPVFILGVLTLFFAVVYFNKPINPALEIISYYLLLYVGTITIVGLLFSPPKPAVSILHKSPELGKAFLWRSVLLGGWATLGLIIFTVFRGQPLSIEVLEVAQTAFYILLSVGVVWFCWLVTKIPLIQKTHKAVANVIRVVLLLCLIAIILTQTLGYHRFALHLIFGIFFTFIAVGLFWVTIKIVGGIGDLLNSEKYLLTNAIRSQFGLKYRKRLTEFALIKFSAYVTAFFVLIIFLMRIWGVSLNMIDYLQNALLEGFAIAKLKIIPSQIIIALLTFGILLMISRWISSFIKGRYEFEGERQTQVAVASIIGYIGFAISLLIALLVAGIDFTGLAVIAGALSVGIGLGLQSIVNNFVSGIILLLEKPIKTGDRVIVNGIEGFVKKVRIRSTQIETIKREDIIVPNSDLITQQVTNFMFGDNYGRVVCSVGVAYGSNIDLVRETLLNITIQNEEVVQEEPNNPTVLFKEFGNSSLNFSLFCTIRDVNKRYKVMSDLNFAIDMAFREKNITIAFPQLDIHMKRD